MNLLTGIPHAKIRPRLIEALPSSIYGWGYNADNYPLGLGDTSSRTSGPVVITTGGQNWSKLSVSVEFSPGHCLALTDTGELWVWGDGATGGLGTGDQNDVQTPTRLGSDTWLDVAAGYYSIIAIKSDGTIWTAGINNVYDLGLGHNTWPVYTLTQIGSASNWVSVASAARSTLAINSSGELWGWGYNLSGELGTGNQTIQQTPVQIGSGTNWSKVVMGSNANSGSHALAIKTDGTLWACGDGLYGQLGQGNTSDSLTWVQIGSDTDWAEIDCGGGTWSSNGAISAAIKTNGELYTWGSGNTGALGNGTTSGNVTTPTRVGTDLWSKIACGGRHMHGIKTNGTLWGWGENSSGEVGANYPTDQSTPVQVGTGSGWIDVFTGGERNSFALSR